jgi:3-hydroxyacyl-CoA dehydrogenase
VVRRSPGLKSLADLKLGGPPVAADAAASLWDLGQGVGLIDLHAKNSVAGGAFLRSVAALLSMAQSRFASLVLGGEARNFCIGADLREILRAIDSGGNAVEEYLRRGQALMLAIKYSPIPVVAAVRGWALGGGCELALHCSAIQALAECGLGLVEAKVGLLPGWGGSKELLRRLGSLPGVTPEGAISRAFNLIRAGHTCDSALQARHVGFLGPHDGITFNSDYLLADAHRKAIELSRDYCSPQRARFAAAGADAMAPLISVLDAELAAGQASAHDVRIGRLLAAVLCGGAGADPGDALDEDLHFRLERAAFVELSTLSQTRERIVHMLETGKPLRN